MRKLLFRIKNNSLLVKERVKLNEEFKNNLNTNVISCNELIFSDEYLINNEKIVSVFLQELTNNYSIDTLIVEKMVFLEILLKVFKKNKNIINLIIKDDEQLTFSICEAITKTNIKNIRCFNLQPFMIEYLDKYNCMVESRSEMLFTSNFMLENNLNIFSSLFYKVTLQIDLPMDQKDEEDFIAFCKINKYLKTINVNKVNKNDLEFIISTLRSYNKKYVKIVIHDNIEDEETINYLKKFNKTKKKRYKISFKLAYSNTFIKDNLLKQTNNNILKVCGYIIIAIIAFTFLYVFYDNYNSMQNIEKIQENIKTIVDNSDGKNIISNINDKKYEDEKKAVNEDIASLFQVNPEAVAWLNVPGTNIDYPVVQTTNNSYYLKHDINLKYNLNGWVFMDYRNSTQEIGDNTIIYAHNRYYSGVMFGTLQNTLRSSWYKNSENHIINLKTLYDDLSYQVFSVYKIATTTDYLQTLFINNEDKLELFNILKDRSIYDFEVELTKKDKILTLSTCADENNRYVLHAVLIEKEA